jgi:alpha-L-fucosidase 2
MAFTGNGMLGLMVTAGNATPADIGTLRFDLGRTDAVDGRMPGSEFATGKLKCDRPRLPLGFLQLERLPPVVSATMRLALYDAQVLVELALEGGATVQVSAITHATEPVHVINVLSQGLATAPELVYVAQQGDSPQPTACQHYTGNLPFVNWSSEGGVRGSVQPLLCGQNYASGLANRTEADGSTTYFVTTTGPNATTEQQAIDAVVKVLTDAMASGRNALLASHHSWWHAFYPASFLTLSNAQLE